LSIQSTACIFQATTLEVPVTALTRLLFPLPDYRRTPLTLLRWWEARRLTYNLLVGGAGLVTLAVVGLVSLLPPRPALPAGFPWLGVVVYGVLANVCYSLGWLVEMAMRALWRNEAPHAGPALFRQGLSFSIGLTLLPIPLVVLSWVVRVVGRLLS
jgi:hypothetical protein